MPVYEIVMQPPNGKQRVRFTASDALTEIGDVLTLDGTPWVVIAKEPPFEKRRIERLVCTPRQVQRARLTSRRPSHLGCR